MIAEIILYAIMVVLVWIAINPKNLKDFSKKISFNKIDIKKFVPNVIKYTFFLLIASIAIGVFFVLIGMEKDAMAVREIISKFPVIEMIVSVFFAAIAEEILFRGYLLKNTNILISSFLFGISHMGYGSITEVTGAFVLGIILAKQMRETKNVWNVIATHLLFDIVVLVAIFGA